MGEWKESKLGEYVDSISETYKFKPKEKVVFLNTSDIYLGRIVNRKLQYANGLPGQAKKKIRKGDFLFSEIRPANGRYAIIDFEAENYVVSTKLMVLRCRDQIDKNFFRIFLTSKERLEYLQMLAEDRSGTFPQITFDHIHNLDISLPPLSEQKAIASVLSSLDDKIDLLHRQNKILEAMAETLFRQWFVEEAHEDWFTGVLSDHCDIIDCLHSKKPDEIEYSSYYLLQVYNIGDKGKIDFKKKYHVIEEDYNEWVKRIELTGGEMIISKTGRVAAMAQIPDYIKAGIGRNIVAIKTIELFTKEFLKDLMMSSWMDRKIHTNTSDGTILQSLHVKSISKLPIINPGKKLIIEYSDTVRPIHQKININLKQIQTLEKLRDTILPKLMSGEVRIEYEN